MNFATCLKTLPFVSKSVPAMCTNPPKMMGATGEFGGWDVGTYSRSITCSNSFSKLHALIHGGRHWS